MQAIKTTFLRASKQHDSPDTAVADTSVAAEVALGSASACSVAAAGRRRVVDRGTERLDPAHTPPPAASLATAALAASPADPS